MPKRGVVWELVCFDVSYTVRARLGVKLEEEGAQSKGEHSEMDQ